MQLSKVLQSAGVEIHSGEGRLCLFILQLPVADLTELTSTMEFVLAQLWIQTKTSERPTDEHSTIHNEQLTDVVHHSAIWQLV